MHEEQLTWHENGWTQVIGNCSGYSALPRESRHGKCRWHSERTSTNHTIGEMVRGVEGEGGVTVNGVGGGVVRHQSGC